MKLVKIQLFLWVLLSAVVLLIPGPDWWKDRFQDEASYIKSESKKAKNQSERSIRSKGGDQEFCTQPNGGQLQEGARKFLYTFFRENLALKGQLGHLIPMIGIAFFLAVAFRLSGMGYVYSICVTMAIIGSFSFFIEFLQELLPRYFARGFGWDDIGIALLGGFLGSAASVFKRGKLSSDSENIKMSNGQA